jgi:filamentous hemagglutinin family protein
MFLKDSILRSRPARLLVWIMTFLIIVMPCQPVLALPSSPNVTHGDVNFYTVGDNMVVVQQTGSAIVNYGSFSIAGSESVRFVQPSGSAAILNRVTGGSSSTIAGDLLANGRVYLINPNGILFTASAHVDVGALVASGLNMSDSDFLSGRMYFSGGGGSVINEGSINAGSRAYLVGANVENRGSIRAGRVVLAAGRESVLIDRAAGGEIRIVIDGDEELAAASTNRYNVAAVMSNAQAQAAGAGSSAGTNVTASVAQADNELGELAQSGNNGVPVLDPSQTGTNGLGEPELVMPNPEPELEAQPPRISETAYVTNGLVYNWGTIDVSGRGGPDDEADGTGGEVVLAGARVGQMGTINADGTTGDGGIVSLLGTEVVMLNSNSVMTANAGLNGNGGDVILISKGGLYMQAGSRTEALGGTESGDGGYIETSGWMQMELEGNTSTRAFNGQAGTYYIDPPNFYIDDDGDREDCNFLGFDCDYTIDFNESLQRVVPIESPAYMDVDTMHDLMDEHGAMAIQTRDIGGSGSGQIAVEDGVDFDDIGSGGVFLLDAGGNLFINGSLYDSDDDGDEMDIYLLANGGVVINSSIESRGGDVVIVGGRDAPGDNGVWINASINSTGNGDGDMTIYADRGQVQVSASLNAGSGDIVLYADPGESVYLFGGTYSGNRVTAAGNYVQIDNAHINASADAVVQADGSSINMASGGRVTAGGDVLVAATTTADITGLSAGGTVVVVGRSITDAGGTYTDVAGNRAVLLATNGAVGSGNAIDTAVNLLAGYASSGGFAVNEADSVTIGLVPTVSIVGAGPTGSTFSTSIPAFTGLVAQGSGSISITAGGTITISETVAQTGNGGVTLTANGGSSDVTVNDVVYAANGTVKVTAGRDVLQNDLIASGRGGAVVVDAGDDIVMASGELGFAGQGNIRYSAADDITLASVITSNGSISVIAGDTLTQNSNILTLANGTIDVSAGAGGITMANGALAVANGNVRYSAGGTIRVGGIISTQGNVMVTSSSGSILDNGDAHADIVGHRVQFSAPNGSVGSSANALEMGGTNIAAAAGSGGIFLGVGNNVIVDTVNPITVNRVNTSGNNTTLNGSSQSGFTTTGGGDIVLLNNGSIVVNQAVSGGGSANILLANSTNGVNNITLNNAVSSGSGSITIAADGFYTQNANGDISTVGGDVVVVTKTGTIVMANGALTTSGGGDIMYVAPQSILVGGFNAGAGQVTLVATKGNITDNGDTHKDVVAGRAVLIAPTGTVGSSGNFLETDLGNAAAYAGNGGIYITEDNDVTFGTVPTNFIRIVGTDGLTTLTNMPQLSGLIASNGNIFVDTTAGSITISSIVANLNSGDIRLNARGGGSDVNVRGLVVAQSGDINIYAADSITQTTNIIAAGVGYINVDAGSGSISMTNKALTFAANGPIRYDAGANATIESLITSNGSISVLAGGNIVQNSNIITLAGGTVDVDANGGSITMKDGALSLSGTGNIRYEGAQNVTVSGLIATQGNVSVISTFGSILDAGSNHPDVVAHKAQFLAINGGVGTQGASANALEIGVSNVAALAGNQGINLAMGGNVIIDTVSPITVNRVASNGTVSTVGGSTISGFITASGGGIVGVGNGQIIVRQPVAAGGTGNVLIANTTGTVNNIILEQAVSSGSGDISIAAGNGVRQNSPGDITTVGGDIVVVAQAGDIFMTNGALASSSGGNILYLAETNLYVGGINSGAGDISAVALQGDIIDNGNAHKEFSGGGAQLIAPLGTVGTQSNRIDTALGTLSAYAGDGGIYVTEDNNLIIGTVGPVTVNVVGANGIATPTNTPALAGLIASNGQIMVETIAGSIQVQAPVYNLEDGNILIEAKGGGSDVAIDALVYSYNGNIVVLAPDSITQSTNIISGGNGYINLDATAGSITMSNKALTFAANGNVRYDAGTDITAESIITSNGYISVTAGSDVFQRSNLVTIAGGTLDVDAENGSIIMNDGSVGVAGTGNVRYEARSNVVLSTVIATQNNVSIIANYGSIFDAGTSLPNVVSVEAQLWAPRGGVGTLGPGVDDRLELGIQTVAGLAGTGGINIGTGGFDLEVGTVDPVIVQRVQADGTVTPLGGTSLSGLTATGGGSIVAADLEALTINDIVQVEEGGHILLAAQTGLLNRITVNTNIISEAGHITLYAGNDIYQNLGGDISTEGGDIVVLTKDGPIVMADGTRAISSGGNIGYIADTNLFLAGLDAGTGQVAVVALDGSIYDNGDTHANVVADDLQFFALNGHIGSYSNRIETDVNVLAALAQNGDVNITEDDDLIIGTVGPVALNGVFLDSTLRPTNTPSFTGVVSTNGNVLIDTLTGSITIDGIVGSLSTGNVRIVANGGGSDITINDLVLANEGQITLIASDSVIQNTNIISQASGSIDVEALNGSITMQDGSLTFANQGDIGYRANGDITLASLIATQGQATVISTLGSILDGGDDLPEIIAVQASLFATNGGIGVLGAGVEDPLEVGIGTVSAVGGEGGINMFNGGDVVVGTVTGVTVARIMADGTTNFITAPDLSGMTTVDDGAIVFASIGSMTVDDAIAADGTGNVLLATATGVVNSVLLGAQTFINAPVSSSNGNISIVSGEQLVQNVDGDISTFGGDLSVLTFDGSIIMSNGALSETHGGNVLYVSSSNVLVGGIDADTGDAGLVALGGSIYDNGDTHTNVVGNAVQFVAQNGAVGTPTNGIETTVNTLTALGLNGGVKITESDDVTIGGVGPVEVRVVGFDSTTSPTSSPLLSGIIVSNGHLLVDTVHGSITATSAVINAGAGNLLLDANGEGADIVVSNIVLANIGNLSLNADDSIRQYEDVISAAGGSMEVEAMTGGIFMADGSLGIANGGDLRYVADRDITVGGLISPSGTISIISWEGSILDGGDLHKEVLSPYLRLHAGGGVGSKTNPIDTIMGFVSARAGSGGVHVNNQGITIIDTVPAVTVDRVNADGTVTSITDETLSDIITTNNGGVSIETINGTIVISDGLSPDDSIGIQADGTGTVCVIANGTNSSLIIDADVLSGTGDISLIADKSVVVNSNATRIATSGQGAIGLWADQDDDGSGDFIQLTGKIQTQGGNIYLYGENVKQYGGSIVTLFGNISIKAGNKIQLTRKGKVTSYFGGIVMEAKSIKVDNKVKGGKVLMHATRGSITGKGTITGGEVSLNANDDIGKASDPLDIDAGTLAALTDTGDIYLNELNSVQVGQVERLLLGFGKPECCEEIPVAFAPTIDGVQSAGLIIFDVGSDLSGNRIVAQDDIDLTVNGDVNGLDLLESGQNIDLEVDGNYEGQEILADNDLIAEIGGTLRFDTIEADLVEIMAGTIFMSELTARQYADIQASRDIFDEDSMVTAPDITMVAGNDIGPDSPIQLDVDHIDLIQGGRDVAVVQNKPGDTPMDRIEAGRNLYVGVPNGGLVDDNGDSLNIIAADATIDAQYIGELEDGLEVRIEPGNLKVDDGTLDGPQGEGYIFVHVDGVIGEAGDHYIEYIGGGEPAGLIIFNDRILGGPDDLVRRFYRAAAFLQETKEIKWPMGWLDAAGKVVTLTDPSTEGYDIFLQYILRNLATITADADMPADATRTVKLGETVMIRR